MSEDKAGGEIQDDFGSLLTRLKKIEHIRKSQSMLRGACLVIVFVLMGSAGVVVYGSYRELDSGKFAQNLKKELRQEFEPDLEKLAKEGEVKLLPALKEELKKSLKERLPKIQARYEKLANAKVEEIRKKFEQNGLVYFHEFEAAFQRELPEEEMKLVFQKLKKTEDQIMEQLSQDVRKEMETVRPKIEEVQDSLHKLAQKPEVRNLSMKEAKDLFLEAIDLVKYEIVKERGDLIETIGEKKSNMEARR